LFYKEFIMEITVREGNIHYEIIGSGRPIVMVHGWGCAHEMFKGSMEPIFADMGSAWQRIYFDMPGMGMSPAQRWITGSDDMQAVILEFIDKVIPGQHFLIAGKSYGGYLARGILKARPAQVDGLLLICASAVPDHSRRDVPPHQAQEVDPAFLDSLSAQDRKDLTENNVIHTRRVWERFRDEVLPGLKAADWDFLNNCLSRNTPYVDDIDQIEVPYPQPALLLMGRQDASVGYRDHWKLLENYPHASFLILDKAGHNLEIEQPELFTALVKEWFSRVT
jgi:pimeloyl-ACP methyl ester carboxylesterase